jgi:hypothetical protein
VDRERCCRVGFLTNRALDVGELGANSFLSRTILGGERRGGRNRKQRKDEQNGMRREKSGTENSKTLNHMMNGGDEAWLRRVETSNRRKNRLVERMR